MPDDVRLIVAQQLREALTVGESTALNAGANANQWANVALELEAAVKQAIADLEAGAAAPVEGTRQPSDSTRSHLHE